MSWHIEQPIPLRPYGGERGHLQPGNSNNMDGELQSPTHFFWNSPLGHPFFMEPESDMEMSQLTSPDYDASWECFDMEISPISGSEISHELSPPGFIIQDSSYCTPGTVAPSTPGFESTQAIEVIHDNSLCSDQDAREKEENRKRTERRREQNRISQRIFRARKESRLQETSEENTALKRQIVVLQETVEVLERRNHDLEGQVLASSAGRKTARMPCRQ